MPRYMLIMRSTDEAEAAAAEMDLEEIIAAMGRYNESMMQAGVLVAGEGLTPAAEGAVVAFTDDGPVVSDGPYGETKELFNGFWILDVPSRDDAVAWARRAPLGPGTQLEVRRVAGDEDFPQDNEWVRKEKVWREQLGTN